MKKYSWIAALLLVAALVFMVGCPDGDSSKKKGGGDDGDEDALREWQVVFDMQDAAAGAVPHGIQALPDGKLTFGNKIADPQPLLPIIRAGNEDAHVTVDVVAGAGGKKALEFTTGADWGAGLDLLHTAFGFFGGNKTYPEGDKIIVKGEVLTIGTGDTRQFYLNGQINNSYKLKQADGTEAISTATGAFDWTVVLDAEAISKIMLGTSEGSAWPGIRLSGNGKGTKVRIDNIRIEGYRAVDSITLAAPVIAVDGDTLSWSAVDKATGYALYAGDTKVLTLGPEATSTNLKTALNGQPEGAYQITLVAVGAGTTILDSPKSNAVSYNFVEFFVPIKITIDSDTDVDAKVKIYGSTAEFEATTGNTGYKVTGGHDYSTSFPIVVVDLPTGKKLSDIASVVFDAKQVSGDVGYKRFQVSAAPAGTTVYKAITRKSADRWEGATAGATKSINLPVFASLVTASTFGDGTSLAFSINPGVNSTAVYEITGIVITTTGNAADEVISGALLDIALAAPVTGGSQNKTITPKQDGGENPAYTGTVTWDPDDDPFEVDTEYEATITLTAATTYTLAGVGTFTVNGEAADSSTGGTVVYTFPETFAAGEPAVIFDLSEETLTDGAWAGISGYLGFNAENTGTAEVVTEDGKQFIRVTKPDDNGASVVILTENIVAGLRHKITITGATSASADRAIEFQLNGVPGYGNVAGVQVFPSGTNNEFTVEHTFSWADISSYTAGFRVILNQWGGTKTGTTIDYYTIKFEAIAND